MEAGTKQRTLEETVKAEKPKAVETSEREQTNFDLVTSGKNNEIEWREENWSQEQEEADSLYDPDDESCTDTPSFSAWLVTAFLLLVPVVNLIVLFEWATGNTKYSIRVNFAKAMIPEVLAVYVALAIGIVFI